MKLLLITLVTIIGFFNTPIVRADQNALPLNAQSYQPISYLKLAAMIWRYQLYETDNTPVLDDYIRIMHCDMYERYYENDFLWGNTREGFRRYLNYYAHQFPNRFEIKTAIPLGRYDFDRAVFTINDDFKMDNAGAIEIPVLQAGSPCGFSEFVPWNMKFNADNNFALVEVPVAVDDAENLLRKIKKYRYEGLSESGDRALAVRFRISVNNVRMNWNRSRDERVSIIFQGQLDEIAFFADPEMTDLVWRKPFVELEGEF